MKIRTVLSNLLSWVPRSHKAPAVLKNPLPVMKMGDGSAYEPPPEVLKAIELLMSLSEVDYMRATIYMAPFRFYFVALELANNPLLEHVMNARAMENYWRYHANEGVLSPPPALPKPGSRIQ